MANRNDCDGSLTNFSYLHIHILWDLCSGGDGIEQNERDQIMTKDVYNIYETVINKMCSRCSVDVRLACLQTDAALRYSQMCICIDKILKPDDGEYPTRLED